MNYVTEEDLNEYIYGPEEAAKIIPASAFCQNLIDRFYGADDLFQSTHKMPWSKTHGKINFRPSEVSIWAGYNGSGKSNLLGQICLGIMSQGGKVCIASMEMKPAATLGRMVRQSSGYSEPSIQYIRDFSSWTNGKLWIYDQQGTVTHPRILSVCRYAADKLKIQHIVIDSLMKCGINTDDYNLQKTFLDQLCACAKDLNTHIHLVAHARKGDSEQKTIDKMSVKGASEITDMADNVFTLWRNKRKEDESVKPDPDNKIISMPDVLLTCEKQRHGEWEGKINLWYDKESMQYVTSDGARPIDFMALDSESGHNAGAFSDLPEVQFRDSSTGEV